MVEKIDKIKAGLDGDKTHLSVLAGDVANLKDFYACAGKELDAYEIVELMLVMTECGIFDDKVKFDV